MTNPAWLARGRTLLAAGTAVAVLAALFSLAPRGVGLQLAFTAGQFVRAWGEWVQDVGSSRLAALGPELVVRLSLLLDFFFIPAYAVLLAGLYLRFRRPAPGPGGRRFDYLDWLVTGSCLAAAVFDVLENLGLLWLTLEPTRPSPVLVRLTSSVSALKWAGLALAILFVVRAFVSGPRRRVLWLSRYSILSMLLGSLPLVASSQGRDLILALGSREASIEHRVFFYLTLSLWGLSVWYWTRLLLDAEISPTDRRYEGFARHLPRVMGAVTLVLPGIPIALASNEWWTRAALIAGCAALAAVFWFYVSRRRYAGADADEPVASGFSLTALPGTRAAALAAGSLILSLVLFVFFVFAPLAAGRHLGALAILFVAAANTVFFGSAAVFASEHWRIRIDAIAFACAAAFSFWNDNHDVFATRLDRALRTLEQEFRAWRSEQPMAARRPVFIVSAEGGGLRAAFWTATVLGGLDTPETPAFPANLFAVSSISGGTLGAAVYAGLRQDLPEPPGGIQATAQAILSRDFLSPTLAKLVTGDFAQWFLPVPVHRFDRSLAMEAGFERAYFETTKKNTFAGPITALMPDARRGVPAVLMNTTIVDTGEAAIIAPFTWQPADLPLTTLYVCWVGECAGGARVHAAPTLAQSIHNSARFTYVSPAGLVRDLTGASLGHVVDAGYYDPTGVQTALDLARALRRIDPSVTIVPIYVTNSTVESDINKAALAASVQTVAAPGTAAANERTVETPLPSAEARRTAPVEILGEVFAPVRALLRTRTAHGRVAIARQRLDERTITFGFCRAFERGEGVLKREEDRPEPPLGWQLSQEMIDRLKSYWDCPGNKAGVEAVKNWLR